MSSRGRRISSSESSLESVACPAGRVPGRFDRVKNLASCCALAVCFVLACDGGDKPSKDAKAGDAKKTADAKKGDAKKEGDAKAEAKPAEKHFDISHDKSGVLARSAAVLEGVDKLESEDLHELSHHAEKLPSYDKVCTHIASIRGDKYDKAACIKEYEHHVAHLGPELYAEVAACELESKTKAELDVCDAAEAEAEKLLHEKPHGDGLDADTCDKFFVQFEKLAMAEAGDDAELVKTVLEEVKADLIEGCTDQGTKAEIECGMKAKSMHELRECAPALL